jgi:hypothetical protein
MAALEGTMDCIVKNLQPIPLTDCASGGPNTISLLSFFDLIRMNLASSYPWLVGIRGHLDSSSRLCVCVCVRHVVF